MGCHPARVRVSWLNLLSLLLALFGLAAVSWIEPHFVLYSNDAPMRFLYFRAVVTITGVGPSVVGAVVAACALRRGFRDRASGIACRAPFDGGHDRSRDVGTRHGAGSRVADRDKDAIPIGVPAFCRCQGKPRHATSGHGFPLVAGDR